MVKRFRDAGVEPEGYVLYTYAAIQVWKQAAEKAGTVDPAKVTAMLHSDVIFDTVIAKLSFNKTGDVKLPGYVFYEWKKGQLRLRKLIGVTSQITFLIYPESSG